MLYAHTYIYVYISICFVHASVCVPDDRKAYTIILPTIFEQQQRQRQSCQTAGHKAKVCGISVPWFFFLRGTVWIGVSIGLPAAAPTGGPKHKQLGQTPDPWTSI